MLRQTTVGALAPMVHPKSVDPLSIAMNLSTGLKTSCSSFLTDSHVYTNKKCTVSLDMIVLIIADPYCMSHAIFV